MSSALFAERSVAIIGSAQDRFEDFVGSTPTIPVELGTPPYQLTKRVIDCVVSFLLIVLLSPVLLVLALLIKLTSRGPVFLSPLRSGRKGRSFQIYKLRTMTIDTDASLASSSGGRKYLGESDDFIKTLHDPRITKLGRFLRRTNLDDLPQLFNVLRGDLALVGPRSLLPQQAELLIRHAPDLMRDRDKVPPGMMSLWQVTCRGELDDFSRMIVVDLIYIDKKSVWLDTRIFFFAIYQSIAGVKKGRARLSKPAATETDLHWLTRIRTLRARLTAPRTEEHRGSSAAGAGEITGPVEFGDFSYPLRTSLMGRFGGRGESGFTFQAAPLDSVIVGHGKTEAEAFDDWREGFHVLFQSLYRKSAMDRTVEEQRIWRMLAEDVVEIGAYQAGNQWVLRQIGKVVEVKRGPSKVEWSVGVEEVNLTAAHADFTMLQLGDWFEATVARNLLTDRLEKILHVQRIEPLEFESPDALARFWDALPTTSQRPDSTRDWSRQ